ncbi:MAG: TolC family protein [Bacteroidota bacterium]|nr:TolC family protein [Bacteroidota bacterium]
MRKIEKIKQDKSNSIRHPKSGVLFILLTIPIFLFAQSLTIETCQEKAKANYPLVKQYGLIEQTAQYNISNANKGYLPQLSLSAKATYQSEVTQIPAVLGQTLSEIAKKTITFPSLSKDQYQAVAEANQLIWDGGVIAAQKKITHAGTEVEKQKLDVDLFALNERINQLFFGILLMNEQIRQNEILINELEVDMSRIAAYKQNGVANQADLDALKVERLNAGQHDTELKSTRKSYLIMLSAYTRLTIDENTELIKPEINLASLNDTTNHRPELKLFDAQNKMYESQKLLLNAGNLPKIGAFLQGGYGKPGLNMFTDGFSPFYIGGIRLSWNFSGLYSQKNNLNKLEVSKKMDDIQKETFLFNNSLLTKQQRTEIEKLQSTLMNDDEIIRLRGNIKKSTSAKVDNGTLTVTDLIRETNTENQAIQLKSLHEIQLILSVYQLKNSVNN